MFHDSNRDSIFATHVRDYTSDSHLRLGFATTLATPDRAPTATRYFWSRLTSCNPTTDGRTVLTTQRHLPSIPPPNPIKKFWNLVPGLVSTSSYYLPSCPPPPVALCPLTRPLAQHPFQRPLHLLPGPLPTSPHLSHPLNLPLFPLYGNTSLMF